MSNGAYNPSDPIQNTFLDALASSENASHNPWLGFGGVDLSRAPVDRYGFPQWAGVRTAYGPTHAAGLYQFQPGTWGRLASQYGLDFRNVQDQNAGAWNLAADTFKAKTGQDLETALKNGNYSQVASVLGPTWTSLNTSRLETAYGHPSTSAPAGDGSNSSGSTSIGGYIANALGIGNITNLFVRGAVFFLGFLLIAFGLYYLADQASGGAVGAAAKEAALAA